MAIFFGCNDNFSIIYELFEKTGAGVFGASSATMASSAFVVDGQCAEGLVCVRDSVTEEEEEESTITN